MTKEVVPDIVIARLPRYLQCLNLMAKEGLHTVSSGVLAERLGTTAAQIRKDLSYFGGFGKQGSGYPIYSLIEALQEILNLDRIWQVAVVGAGDLGRALTRYQGFPRRGIEIKLLFDVDPKLVGTKVGSITIQHVDYLEKEIQHHGIKIGVLAVPAEYAQLMADRMVEAGIEGILSYAPVSLILPESVHAQHIDPVLQLQTMMYYLGED
ncbi:MAG: redox-sensing transcriptional repressor Rex [Brevefilum sp.]|nr:redox-sensing transcriptional repressor Rex [Brevefilum sp.]MDT8381339.1 redox-sensing transcriptional repressor Rex [Brevefilum sp.]MDW7754270.1 redox-sensing transcriptional repressor Rex [Brevefilum sp.]